MSLRQQLTPEKSILVQQPCLYNPFSNNFVHIFSSLGFKGNSLWGTPYAAWTFETDIVLNCMIYVACVLHPILYFALNPDYRSGMVQILKRLCCQKDSTQVSKLNGIVIVNNEKMGLIFKL